MKLDCIAMDSIRLEAISCADIYLG